MLVDLMVEANLVHVRVGFNDGYTAADFRDELHPGDCFAGWSFDALASLGTGVHELSSGSESGQDRRFDIGSDMKESQAPSRIVEITYDNVQTAYFPDTRRIAIGESYKRPGTGEDVPIANLAGATRHVSGHAFDHAIRLREMPEMREGYRLDMDRIHAVEDPEWKETVLGELCYYSERLGGLPETIAEGFAILAGGGTAPWQEEVFREWFPHSLAVLQERLEDGANDECAC